MCKVYQTKIFKKQLRKFDKNIKKKIMIEIENIKKDPLLGDKLKGSLNDFSRIRVDKYRLVYRFHESPNRLELIYVGLRKNVYTELERLRKEKLF